MDRLKKDIPNPVYTCEKAGKIVVNITVDSQGNVTSVSLNENASTSSNGCLIDNALKYAKTATFQKSNRITQIGTITYSFATR